MSHHGREGDREWESRECKACNKLGGAVELLKAIANGHGTTVGTRPPAQLCEAWLDSNGFDCVASQRRAHERRAVELAREIKRLLAERATLK